LVSQRAKKGGRGNRNITVVVAGNFFVNGGFSPNDAPTHLRVTAAGSSVHTAIKI